jgi:hypothetical protein
MKIGQSAVFMKSSRVLYDFFRPSRVLWSWGAESPGTALRFLRAQEMQQHLDPRDEWEYFRIRAMALGYAVSTPRGHHSGEAAVRVLRPQPASSPRTLRDILAQQGKLKPDRAVWITLGICSELGRIHRVGAIHGDLRPEDVIIESNDEVTITRNLPDYFSTPLELGLSAVWNQPSHQSPEAVAYISPEQARGKGGTARSDLYAVGIMLYEMLTGSPPFEGSDSFTVMYDRLANHPVPLRNREPAIAPELQEVVCRLLEPNPQRRYGDVCEVAWDLTHPEQVSVPDRPALKTWNRRRSHLRRILLDVALALVPVAVLVALLFYLTGGS